MESLTTLGYGDIVPTGNALLIMVAPEGLVGFALLTAALSWVLSVYPALNRHRSLVREAALLWQFEQDEACQTLECIDGQEAARRLGELAKRVIEAQGHLTRFPITY